VRGGRAAQAKIGIDYIDVSLMPSEFAGALAQRVLQPQALLIAHDLVRCRLPDIDDRLARQMGRLHQFGLHERPPPGRQRRRRRFDAAASATALTKGILGLYSSSSTDSATDTISNNASMLSLV
jgi:hypothetical protein